MNLSRTQFVVAIVLTLFVGVLAAWFARPLFVGDSGSAESVENGDAVYTCPMHPAVVSDTPGTCPICHMDLVKQTSSGGDTFSDEELEDIAHVAISPAQRVLANVHTTRARAIDDMTHDEEYDAQTGAQNDIRAVGVMAADQEGLAQVPSWLDGRIDRLRIKKVGTVIKRGEAVMDIYSEDLYAAQQEFLLALESASEGDADNPNSLLNLTRQRLLLRGMNERQIRNLEKTRKVSRTVTVQAPNAGTVTEVLVRQGQYVETGTPLFAVADLSNLRVEAQVRARDLPDVNIGARARIVSDRGDSSRQGRVEFIEPTINPQTRTVKVRIKLNSDDAWLPKDAFVTAYIERAEARSNKDAHEHHDHGPDASTPVLVPRSSVIRGGIFNRVYVEREENVFEQRNVEIGAIDRTYITVTSGLKPGEIVVTTGGFLLDSEVQLHSFASGDDDGHAEHGPPVLRQDISEHGREFDPPIHIDQAPNDVWLCNMNDSVHWIQIDKKDGICPLCKMDLIHHTKDDDHTHDNAEEIKREDIPDEGQAFSPSIPIEQAPDDVWLCNMGDFVHWIQRDKKDATCPLCNMDLIHHTKDDAKEVSP